MQGLVPSAVPCSGQIWRFAGFLSSAQRLIAGACELSPLLALFSDVVADKHGDAVMSQPKLPIACSANALPASRSISTLRWVEEALRTLPTFTTRSRRRIVVESENETYQEDPSPSFRT